MSPSEYQIRQLVDELEPPESGKQTIVLLDDATTKVVLFAFAAGKNSAQHQGRITGGDVADVVEGADIMRCQRIGSRQVACEPVRPG